MSARRLLQFFALCSLAIAVSAQVQVSEPVNKADIIYTKHDSWFCQALGFFGGDPCHVGVYISSSKVVEATNNEGDSVRSTTYEEFRSRGTSPNGFRGSRTMVASMTSAQRDTIAGYLAAKDARLTYYDDNHLNQKGGYRSCSSSTPSCFDGYDYYNEFDCVGLAERVYEYVGHNPTPTEGALLYPEEQYAASGVAVPVIFLSNGGGMSTSVRSQYWKFFALSVPSGKDLLKVATSNGTGDVDLYVRRSYIPTKTTNDCASASTAYNETCTISSPSSGTWAFGVFGYGSASTLGFGIQADYARTPSVSWITPPPSTMTAGQSYTVSWSSSGDFDHINLHWNPTNPSGDGCCLGNSNSTDSSTVSPNSSPLTITAPTVHNGSSITSPVTVKYVVHARHTALALNAYSAVATITVVPPADTSSPETVITGGPTGTTQSTSATFTYTGSDNVTATASLQYAYRLDPVESVYSSYSTSTSRSYSNLSPGNYTFYVRARDGAGNVDPTPATRSFTVQAPADVTPPDTSITGGPSGVVNSGDVSFTYSGSDNVTPTGSLQYAYRLDPIESSFSAYSSQTTRSYGSLANGSYTFYVRARDAAGNVDPSPASRAFTVSQAQPCAYTFSPSTANGVGSGGTGAVQVTGSPSGCSGSWSASSGTQWLTLTGTAGGTGPGSWPVPYSYDANPSTSSTRPGTIVFSGSFAQGNTFTLTQNPATPNACTYSFSPPADTAPFTPGNGSVQISGSPGGCTGSWSASSNQSWLSLTGTSSGSGSGTWTVPYSYEANPNASARSATITIPGATFTLTQNGAAASQANLSPYQPNGWPDKIVITKNGSALDLDWAVVNSGGSEATGFYVDLFVDGSLYDYWYVDQLSPNFYVYVLDHVLDQLTPGAHTFSILADSLNAVSESNETDNVYTRTFVVGGSGAVPDIDGDGRADLLWRHAGSGDNYYWLMNGHTQLAGSALPRVADTNWRIVGFRDFDGDGAGDIAWRHLTTGENYLWYMNGANVAGTTFLPGVPDVNWSIVAVADMNGDQRADFVWRHGLSGEVRVWLMNNTAVTSNLVLGAVTDLQWRIEGAADMNGDGKSDIVWRHYGTGQHYIWLMNGTTRSGSAELPPVTDTTWEIEALADFDGNGTTDIAWRQYTTGENYMWLMNGVVPVSLGYIPRVLDTQWKISGPR